MTLEQILEIIERYKLRIPPTVYYDLLADVQEAEEEQELTTKNDSPRYCDRSICLRNEYNNVGCEDCEVTKSQEPTTNNCESCRYYGSHHEACNYCYKCSLWTEKEPTTKNYLGVDCIDRAELLKTMDTWDKFGNDPNEGLIPLRTPVLRDRYVPYVKSVANGMSNGCVFSTR